MFAQGGQIERIVFKKLGKIMKVEMKLLKTLFTSILLCSSFAALAMEPQDGAEPMDVSADELCQEKLYPIDNVVLDREVEQLVDEGNLEKIADFLNNQPQEKRYPGYSYIEKNYDKHAIIHTIVIATIKGKKEIVYFVIQHYPYARCTIPINSLLRTAAYYNHLDLTKLAIAYGANADGISTYVMPSAQSPLLNAANSGYSDIVKYLIEQGADISWIEIPYRQEMWKYTTNVLLNAIEKNNPESVRAILEAIPLKEQIHFKNKSRQLCAVRSGQPQLVKDVRKIITQNFIELLAQDHVNYLTELIEHSKELTKNPNFRSLRKAEIIKELERQKSLIHLPEFNKTIENNIRRILFSFPNK